MGTFAKNTDVSPEDSMMEIRATLKRYQAKKTMILEEEERVGVAFEMSDRRVRFVMPLPQSNEFQYVYGTQYGHTGRRARSQDEIETSLQKAIRQRWRALLLIIKAKLESVESGIETFEDAFMARLILPSGETVGEWLSPQIERIYAQGVMPPLLGSG